MATIKELLSAMIDKINGNEDKIDNIKGVPEAFDSITMTNGTDMANLTMSAEKELLFNGNTVGGGSGGNEPLFVEITGSGSGLMCNVTADEIVEAVNAGRIIRFRGPDSGVGYPCVYTMKEAGQFGLENKVILTFSITHSDTSGTYNQVYVIMGSNVTHNESFKVARG